MGSKEMMISPSQIHILAFPFPAKGHINPMLHLCNRLAAEGYRITVIATTTTLESVQTKATSPLIKIECVGDGWEKEARQLDDYFRNLRTAASQGLKELLQKFKEAGDYHLPRVVIYDSAMPWVLDVVRSMGVKGASFFTQSLAVCWIYYHIAKGTIQVPFEKEATIRLPSMPDLEFDELPLLHNQIHHDPNDATLRHHTDQFSNLDKVDYILFNSFAKLEDELATRMAETWPIRTVGPTVQLTLISNKKLKNTTINDLQENSLLEANTEACLKWLDHWEPISVIYVSFGSIMSLEKDQMEEVAEALLRIKCKFLWVVRNEEESKLLASFKNDTSKQGLVINWCPQLEVLAHPAVACFVTHCGWNSTIEALSSGVPMIAVPQLWDQPTNAKFVADVWRVGIRAKVNEKGIVSRGELERCIREITENEKGNEMRRNAIKWKELATEAVSEGGTSEKNIEQFLANL